MWVPALPCPHCPVLRNIACIARHRHTMPRIAHPWPSLRATLVVAPMIVIGHWRAMGASPSIAPIAPQRPSWYRHRCPTMHGNGGDPRGRPYNRCFAMGIDAMHCPHCLHHPDCPRWFSLRVPLVGAQTIIAEPWVAMPAIPCIAVRCFLRQHAIAGRCTGVDTCCGRCRSAYGGYENQACYTLR